MRELLMIVEAASSSDWESALDDAETPQDVAAAIQASGARKVEFRHGDPIYVTDDHRVIEWDGKDHFPNLTSFDRWFSDLDVSDYFPDYEDRWNAEFWQHPPPLYHATTAERATGVERSGLNPLNQTRGLSNRSIGAAIFTTSEYEETLRGSYGEVVFTIDTEQMARDGFRPYVTQEPHIAEMEMREQLARQMGIEYEPDYQSDMSPYTVIVYSAIPRKYLTLDAES